MLSNNDLILILTDMQNQGVDVTTQIAKTIKSQSVPFEVLRFINISRPLDVSNFYELLRKNYNNKKSSLYKNLVREVFDDTSDVLTTLAALNLQIVLYASKLEDSKLFLKHSRAEEITRVLNNYFNTYDLIPCLKLLKLIKSDLKAFERTRMN